MPLKKGDLLIFNSLLPHGIRPNLSKNKIRIAQYISLFLISIGFIGIWRIYILKKALPDPSLNKRRKS